jgi:hypothetical protein
VFAEQSKSKSKSKSKRYRFSVFLIFFPFPFACSCSCSCFEAPTKMSFADRSKSKSKRFKKVGNFFLKVPPPPNHMRAWAAGLPRAGRRARRRVGSRTAVECKLSAGLGGSTYRVPTREGLPVVVTFGLQQGSRTQAHQACSW